MLMIVVVSPYLIYKRQAQEKKNFPAHRRASVVKSYTRNFNGYTILLNETLTFLIELMHLMGLFALIMGL